MNGKMLKCSSCKKNKTTAKFRQLKMDPPIYSEQCIECMVKEGKDELDEVECKRQIAAAELRTQYTKELAARELARRRLLHFVGRFDKEYQDEWVHRDICERLERFMRAVERKEDPRLMLFLPPRVGKSHLASNFFPSWLLGHHPEWEVIASSYAISLPIGFSRSIRDRIKTDAYKQVFRTTAVHPESRSAEVWETTRGGKYVAAGVGGGITGKGANVLIIDDPIKDAQEAESEAVLHNLWNWYMSTASTRVYPGGGILIIQTRWSDNDLSGRLLVKMKEDMEDEFVPEEEIDKWEVVSYPALAERDEYIEKKSKRIVYTPAPGVEAELVRRKGESLAPERFPERFFRKKKRALLPRYWSALYQQNPVPDEGDFIKREQFRYYRTGAVSFAGTFTFSTWDLAIGQRQYNDYTVGLVGSIDYHGNLYIRDMVRERWGTYEIVEAFLDFYLRYNCDLMGIERTQLELAIMPVLKQRMQERKLFPALDEDLKPINEKVVRARPLQGWLQQGKIYLPSDQPWTETFVNELLRFPNGVNDDIVDAAAWLVRLASKHGLPNPPNPPKRVKSWRDKLPTHGSESKSFMAS